MNDDDYGDCPPRVRCVGDVVSVPELICAKLRALAHLKEVSAEISRLEDSGGEEDVAALVRLYRRAETLRNAMITAQISASDLRDRTPLPIRADARLGSDSPERRSYPWEFSGRSRPRG